MLVRQTNIIWLLFVACTSVIEFAQTHLKDSGEVDILSTSNEDDGISANHKGASVTSSLRKRKVNSGAKNQKSLATETPNPMVHSPGYISCSYIITE